MTVIEPAHEISVHIPLASMQGSDKPWHTQSMEGDKGSKLI